MKGTLHSVGELRERLEHEPVSIAVVDIDSDPNGVLKELDKVVPLYPQTRFAVVSSKSSEKLILDAMQSGARHFMLKKFVEAELDRVLEKILTENAKTAKDLGSVITVFSAGGGCGATTVAVNVANELQLETQEPVLVVDMDEYYGAISNYLGVAGQYAITDVLQHEGPLDINLISTSAVRYRDNYHVLVSQPRFGKSGIGSVEQKQLAEALEACREGYKYTVIDAPRGPKAVNKTLATSSKIVLVVFQTTVKDIRTAKQFISELKSFGVKPGKIVAVANRFCRRGPTVPLDQTQKAIDPSPLQRVRNDFKHVANSINNGKFLSDCAPRSGVRKDIRKLAERLSAYQGNGDMVR